MKLLIFPRPKSGSVGIFLLGLLIGGCLINLQASREIDRLHTYNTKLLVDLQTRDNQIKLMDKKISSSKELIVEKIQVSVFLTDKTWANSPNIRKTLELEIHKLLNPLSGKPLTQVNPALIQALLHKRVLQTTEEQFQIKLDWLIIGPTMEVQVSAQALN